MYVSIDMGGTKTRVASSIDLKGLYKIQKFNTDREILKQKELLSNAIKFVTDNHEIKDLILGIPGVFDLDLRKFIDLPNYNIVNNLTFNELLDIGIDYCVENDAVLAALGEYGFGAAKEFNRFGYITVGTGVGGCVVSVENGNISFERKEPGHTVGLSNGLSFEENVSGKSFYEKFKIGARECDNPSIWNQYGILLSEGLSIVSKEWDIEKIVIGGGMAKKYSYFQNIITENVPNVKFFKVDLGDNSGLYGGLYYIKNFM